MSGRNGYYKNRKHRKRSIAKKFARYNGIYLGRFDMKRLPEKASETVRIVKVGDYDECLCIGQHVKNTSEIGTFKIISHDYKDGIFRMRFKLI